MKLTSIVGSSLKKCHVALSPLYMQTVPLKTRGIAHSTRRKILSGWRSILSGCLTAAILSADVSPSPDISHPTPAARWERRTIRLPRSGMFGYSDSAYPENIRSRHFSFPEQLSSSDTRDSPDPFPPTIKKQTQIILTTKSPELSLIFNAR